MAAPVLPGPPPPSWGRVGRGGGHRPSLSAMTDRLRDDCFALPQGVDWTPVDEALRLLREGMRCVTGAQEVALAEGAGRVLAEPFIARRSNPPAATSAPAVLASSAPSVSAGAACAPTFSDGRWGAVEKGR